MNENQLGLLRCPYCGTRLSVVDNSALVRQGPTIDSGVLGCECCAFPVIDGIPVLLASDATRDAMHLLEAGRRDEALFSLLALDAERAARFRDLRATGHAATYRQAIDVLSPDAEGTYFLYRFSDPTFVTAAALVRAITASGTAADGHLLDLCGGTGHLTRVLAHHTAKITPHPLTVVADLHFWKLWLATHFMAPGCLAVCCDAEAPLPFARDQFSMVVLSDAFPYIWHKRLCADEIMRLVEPQGVVLMPHLHSVLGENMSAGDGLTPAAYRELFAPRQPRLFSDAELLDGIIDDEVVDLERSRSPEELGGEPSMTLVAGGHAELFRRHRVTEPLEVAGDLTVNPLYAVKRHDNRSLLTLTFPTPEYEAEFGAVKRYLPGSLTVEADLTGPVEPAMLGSRYPELRRRRVVIDAPPRYC